ncbi:MAG: DUF1015 domain-containing protein [Ignavibacteriae bacterium HGW-Ignavibacteriae-4]|jgi:uncharacterized protein (DUF1015 family)|nr:MAG: DUF1015 domain-containing protein [Ignavibacteriae bacterium HGW-Ignavibacteriae-4]
MAIFKPFKAYRPTSNKAKDVAAYPYDVVNSDEAREIVKGNPDSFLRVGKPEVDLDPNISLYDAKVYAKGKENLTRLVNDGILVEDATPCYYVYSLTMNGRTQNGLVGCASVEDYWNDVIKKHEYTRKQKEQDRCEHVRITNAHTGPIFLTYKDDRDINNLINKVKQNAPNNDHVANDGIRHQTWLIDKKEDIEFIQNRLAEVPSFYVADGHHRSAAAAIVGRERREANPNHTGNENYNRFLAVLFPASELYIMDYNRLVVDLNGNSVSEFLDKVAEKFTVVKSVTKVAPSKKGEFGFYAEGNWYKLNIKPELVDLNDPVESLDVALLQKHVLDNLLAIEDPRTDDRIDFVGGIRGLDELVRRVDSGEMKAAISMFPTSIEELMNIADAGRVMPPKSTWFEPKLRDGLFVHFLG